MGIAAVLQEENLQPNFPIVSDGVIGMATVQTVDGRELHTFLLNGDKFTTWIVERIAQYGFIKGEDYTTFSAVAEKGGRPRKEWAVSLGMAKELAMVERNDQGKRARQYFIECERRAKAASARPTIPQTLPEALRLAADLAEQVQTLAPKAEALDRITAADGENNITETAKNLQLEPKKLFKELERRKWIYRRTATGRPIAYQTQIHAGRLTHRITLFDKPDGTQGTSSTVMVTPKGVTDIAALLNVHPPNAPS